MSKKDWKEQVRLRDQDAAADLRQLLAAKEMTEDLERQRDILQDCLLKIRQHHVILNGRVNRSVRESKTIGMIDHALKSVGWTMSKTK